MGESGYLFLHKFELLSLFHFYYSDGSQSLHASLASRFGQGET